jgi:hypothetical protein
VGELVSVGTGVAVGFAVKILQAINSIARTKKMMILFLAFMWFLFSYSQP